MSQDGGISMPDYGKLFESKVAASLKKLDGMSMRVLDGGARAKIPQWCDYIYAPVGAETFFIECKSTGERSLPFANIKDHQLEDLVDIADGSGGTRFGVFAIEFRVHNRMFLIDAGRLATHMATCSRKSLTVEAAESIGRECAKTRGGYDLHVLDTGVSI
jgi:penicillin-binding protein-related factor A (putative recombinase)